MAIPTKITRGSVKKLFSFFCLSTSVVNNEFTLERLSGSRKGIAVFRLNRPEAKNSLSRSLLNSLYDAVQSVKHDTNVRVIILKSDVPSIFCAGADLKERAVMPIEEVPAFVSRLRNLMSEFEQLPQPVIAALDGVALGGGLEMALACDLRVAASNAKLGLVETKLAIIPGAGGTQRLPRIVGLSKGPSLNYMTQIEKYMKAKELIFTGRIIGGAEALGCGLVNDLAYQNENQDAAFQKALLLGDEILPQGPIALNLAKVAIQRGIDVDLHSGLEIEKICYAQVIPTKDRIEGLLAFKEKRKPVYTGE